MADRPTLTQLRKLAREALGGDYSCVTEVFQGEWFVQALGGHAQIHGVNANKHAARRQLRQLLQDIVTGRELREGAGMRWKPAAVGGGVRSGHWHVYPFADGSWCARYWSGFEHEGGAGWVYPLPAFKTSDEAVSAAEALAAPIMHKAEWEEP